MRYKLLIIAGALIVTGAAAAGALYYAYPVQMATYAGMTRNCVISLVAPAGTVTTESNAAYKGAAAVAPSAAAEALSPSARDCREPRRV
jgi:alcohol dehydrogenase (cytochrome c)